MRGNRRIKKWPFVLIGIVAAIAVAVVFVLPGFIQSGQSAQTGNIVSAAAEKSDISTSVVASGNLVAANDEYELPDGVAFDEVLVSKDESVRKGETIATLDASSLTTAIANAKTELATVNDKIDALVDADTNTVYVTSAQTARVKAIYAKVDKKAASILKKNGALAILSTDGMMAVDISVDKNADISVNDSVTVVTSDKTEYTGTVVAISGGKATVTLTDNGPKLKEKVTVKDSDAKLGTGKLYIHAPLRVAETEGKVASVYVSENSLVYSGTTLFTLTVSEAGDTYKTLRTRQSDLVETLEELYALRTTKALYATTAGAISVISDSAITIADADKMEVTVSVDELDVAAVKEGQEVSLTIDALEGEIFNGVVTDVSDEGDTSGSVPKYAATIDVERTDKMKTGMSATATIINEKKEGVIVIPMDAVQEYNDDLYVYTAVDDSGLPTGEKKIETGLSDGTNVEVTSGVLEGDTVYYTVTVSTDTQDGMMMFGGSGMGRVVTSGDGPPGGGGRPSDQAQGEAQ
jgi:multidrug efflux pump subunit AcrA (membrane-fusion protein)